jgi:hypothetical protein
MHDPFQTYATMGTPYGGSPYGTPYGTLNPVGLPYNAQQPFSNPLSSIHPLAAATLGLSQNVNPITGIPQAGQQGFGLHPAQLASQAIIPQLLGINPLAALQNPIVAALLSHPLIAAGLQSQLGQQPQYSQFGQAGGSPFGQNGAAAGIGYPLAPQSWIGQPGQFGGGQAYGQIHPLLTQLASRVLPGQGFSPWGY